MAPVPLRGDLEGLLQGTACLIANGIRCVRNKIVAEFDGHVKALYSTDAFTQLGTEALIQLCESFADNVVGIACQGAMRQPCKTQRSRQDNHENSHHR